MAYIYVTVPAGGVFQTQTVECRHWSKRCNEVVALVAWWPLSSANDEVVAWWPLSSADDEVVATQ